MSLQAKFAACALKAASEAMMVERARCLWCAEQVVVELRAKLDKKFLMSTAHEHAAKSKLAIAEAVVVELRRAIVSGVRPVSGTGQKAGPAVFPLKPESTEEI